MAINQICLNYYNNVMPYLPSDVNDQNRILYLVYALILYAFALLSLFIFIFTKNKVVYSRQKSTFGMVTLTFGFLIAITANVMREYIGRDRYPCFALAWSFHIPVLLTGCQVVGVMYYYIYKLRKERAKTQAIKKMFNDDTEAQSQTSYDVSPTVNQLFVKQKRKTANICNEATDFLFVWRHSKNGKIVIDSTDIAGDAIKSADETAIATHHQQQPMSTSGADNSDKNYKKKMMHAIAEDVGIPVMMMSLFGFHYAAAILLRVYLDPLYAADCVGCRLTYADFIIRLGCGVTYFPLSIIGLYAMRNEDDPLRVFNDMKLAVIWTTFIVVSVVVNFVSSLQGVNDRAIANAFEIIGYAGAFYAFILSGVVTTYIDSYKANREKRKHSNKTGIKSAIIVTSTDTTNKQYSAKKLPPPSALDLNRILEEPKARNALLEHCVNEISSENLVFVFKVRAWKSMWDKEKPIKIAKIAVQLFKEYISKDSKNPINISFNVYSNLEKEIQSFLYSTNTESNIAQSSQTKPNKDTFDECEKECVLMLEHDTLPRFCQSNMFKTEIIESGILPKILKS